MANPLKTNLVEFDMSMPMSLDQPSADMGNPVTADPSESNMVDVPAVEPIADPNDPGMRIDTFLKASPPDDPDLMERWRQSEGTR